MDREHIKNLARDLRQTPVTGGTVAHPDDVRRMLDRAAAALEALLPTPPADVKALIKRLVQIALDVLHHDRTAGSEVDKYERSVLTRQITAAISSCGWRPTREQIARALKEELRRQINSRGVFGRLEFEIDCHVVADAILALTPEAE